MPVGSVPPCRGANVARQYLEAGLVDEMVLHLVPTLLRGGERLFDGVTEMKDAQAGADRRRTGGHQPEVARH